MTTYKALETLEKFVKENNAVILQRDQESIQKALSILRSWISFQHTINNMEDNLRKMLDCVTVIRDLSETHQKQNEGPNENDPVQPPDTAPTEPQPAGEQLRLAFPDGPM